MLTLKSEPHIEKTYVTKTAVKKYHATISLKEGLSIDTYFDRCSFLWHNPLKFM